jgi:hypothetical protein
MNYFIFSSLVVLASVIQVVMIRERNCVAFRELMSPCDIGHPGGFVRKSKFRAIELVPEFQEICQVLNCAVTLIARTD